MLKFHVGRIDEQSFDCVKLRPGGLIKVQQGGLSIVCKNSNR